jgi:serine-type D-Ala-D-Ala carboxypeptidase
MTSRDSTKFTDVEDLIGRGLEDGVFPGAVVLAADREGIVWHRAFGVANMDTGRAVTLETVFDLASLTKPLATSLAIMKLVDWGKTDPDQPIGDILHAFKGSDNGSITLGHLLFHTSGLPDYRPYYAALSKLPADVRKETRQKLLVDEPLVNPVGVRTLYSDLGFMILGWVVEELTGKRLDRFVAETIYRPLGLDRLFFVDLGAPPPEASFAATERCAWRKMLLEGKVHDDNAFAVGGIDGHAGLFGTAEDVYRLISFLLSAYFDRGGAPVFKPDLVRLFFERSKDRDRTLGFDTPSPEDSSSGRYFSPRSVGHLGFTGTSFWVDLTRELTVVLLTNRVHPSRENTRIIDFRPIFHDAVMAHLID